MNKLYQVSTSPHIRSDASTKKVMRDVIIALMPATLFGVFNFGAKGLVLIVACIVTAVLTEYIFEKKMNREITVGDYSAVITGLLLALNLPSNLPIWMACLGSSFSILVVKQLFGGIGQNFMNPALAARCFLLISFPVQMTSFSIEKGSSFMDRFLDGYASINGYSMVDKTVTVASKVDEISGATPLAALKMGGNVDILSMFFGFTSGTIGETSILAILIGGIYLYIRKIITLRIPLLYIGSFLVVIFLYMITGGRELGWSYPIAHLCGGGLIFGAFFMATDYVTSPITPKGKIIYGIFLGVLTAIFRLYGGSAEGVSYAIIIGNMIVPLIEKYTVPKAFGKEGNAYGK